MTCRWNCRKLEVRDGVSVPTGIFSFFSKKIGRNIEAYVDDMLVKSTHSHISLLFHSSISLSLLPV